MQEKLKVIQTEGFNYEIVFDESGLQVRKKQHGQITTKILSNEFFTNSKDYQLIVDFGKKTAGLFDDGAYIQRGEKIEQVKTFSQVFDWLLAQAKKGLGIQRYKGLGEMNPDQLWETTMDPDNRTMLQVNVEDAIAADEMFTTLMGDHVEPRRDFIVKHALTVENLDV